MKKLFCIIGLFVFLCKYSSAQILCIYCYDQNNAISSGVNNLLLNGGFETTTCIPNDWFSSCYCPNSQYYSCDISNWTCTGGGSGTYADITDINYAQVVQGNKAVYFGNDFCNACSANGDDISCLSSTGCTAAGVPAGYPVHDIAFGGSQGVSLAQTVTGLIPGNVYVLEFWAGGEFHSSFHTDGLFAVNIGFGDTLLRNKPTGATDIGTRYIIEFKAVSSSHTIKFTNWGHICTDCTELILDDVRLYTLNELSSSVPSCQILPCLPMSLTYIVAVSSPQLSNGALRVAVSGGEPPYQYSLDSLTFQASNTFTSLALGTYQIYITDDSGCTTQGSFTIDETNCNCLGR